MNRMILFLPLTLLAACGSNGSGDEADDVDPVALVRTAPTLVGASATQTSIYGVAEPSPGGERSLAAPAEAIVGRILAPNGTAVRAGQPIVTLAPSRATAADLAKASADAVAADAAYARARRLRADGLASDADVEAARAAAETARAARANAGGSMVLRAPIAGVVQGLSAKSGDQLAAGTAVASVVANGNLRARFGVDPALAQRVHPGQMLDLSIATGSAQATVPVTGVDTQVDATTRLASVYAAIPGTFRVGPGEALHGALTLAEQAQGLTIPYAALLDDGGKSYVFVVKGGVAHERDVLPGSSSGDRIQILKGLQPGDKVVTEGGTALEDGMKVTEQGRGR